MPGYAKLATILDFNGRRCAKCGMTNNEHLRRHKRSLHAHRIRPGSAYSPENCRSLCYGCHGHCHAILKAAGIREHLGDPDIIHDQPFPAELSSSAKQLLLAMAEFYGLSPARMLNAVIIMQAKESLHNSARNEFKEKLKGERD